MKRAQVYRVGEPVHFEGYADDYDKAIRGVQFSLDNGKNWTEYPTDGARSGCWVWWRFDWEPQAPGRYFLRVRSVNEDGKASPTHATVEFEVV